MSAQDAAATVPTETPAHPIRLVVTDDLARSRLTVFFRLLLAIPHFIWLTLWTLVALLAAFVGWVAAIFLGRLPEGIHNFLAAWLRYFTHVNAYFWIAADPFPGFTGQPGYPVDVAVDPPASQHRLAIFFRFILAIPALIVMTVLQYVLQIVGILAWFYALFTGRANEGMRNLEAYCLRYQAQTYGYLWILTGRYPSFGD